MRFVDSKCADCRKVSEYYIGEDETDKLICPNCGSKNMQRVFAPIRCKSSSNNDFSSEDDYSSAQGGSCSGSCSGCSGCS